jgi:anti-sigma factor RsiW
MNADIQLPDHAANAVYDRPPRWQATLRTVGLAVITIMIVAAGIWLGMALTRGLRANQLGVTAGAVNLASPTAVVASTPSSAAGLPLDNGSGYLNRQIHESDYCDCNAKK